jgi:hypothetical protein
MAQYAFTFTSGDTVTPTKLNDARTVSDIVDADISATAAIAGSKLADGAITDTKVDAAAAIAGTKIAPDFGSQVVKSSGTITAESDADANLVISRASTDVSAGNLQLRKARGSQSARATVLSGDTVGSMMFSAHDGTDFRSAARIFVQVDGTPGTNNMPGRLVFATTPSGSSTPTERMRITGGGAVLVGQSSTIVPGQENTTTGHCLVADGRIYSSCNGAATATVNRNTSNGPLFSLRRQGSVVGSIDVTTTATSFVTSSDYRLKQNVEPMVGGLAKLAALAPKTFEFINEPNVKVDGFIAHEVQAVVPQAVTGEKDGEEMQGLDHSKLVPVLVAAVQELSAKVAALEAA